MSVSSPTGEAVSPLITSEASLNPEQARLLVEPQRALQLSDEMVGFIAEMVPQGLPRKQRVVALYRALRSPGLLGVEYDRDANVSAQQAFHTRRANCLGFSNLFVASAREVGLRPRFQLVDEGPQWSQRGEYVEKALHINVVVPISGNQQYVVDISPRPVSGRPQFIPDRQALALLYNNDGSAALVAGDLKQAYGYFVRALDESPELEMVWVNLGVLFRRNQQPQAAIGAYQMALEINPHYRSAHYNLAIVYQQQGMAELSAYHKNRVAQYESKIREQLSAVKDEEKQDG